MSFAQRWREIRTGFERPFWVANITEIFERLSYYGAFSSLALYLQEQLNFSTQQTGTLGDALKISLTAPPIEGRANHACIEFLADLLKLPRSSITIAAGQTSRNKLIRVSGVSAAGLEARLRRVVT